MKKKMAVLLLGIVALAVSAMAGSKNPIVGGQEMYPTKDIIDNAVNSADHTTLVAAVKAAGLVDTLKGAGPFTVFAPTNEAFAKLPAGTVENLLKPENKDALNKGPDLSRCCREAQRLGLEEANQGWRWAGDVDHGERGHARCHDAGRQCRPEGREGRSLNYHHPQRFSVERCDSRS